MLLFFVSSISFLFSAMISIIEVACAVFFFAMNEAESIIGRFEERLSHEHEYSISQVEYGGGYVCKCRKCGHSKLVTR